MHKYTQYAISNNSSKTAVRWVAFVFFLRGGVFVGRRYALRNRAKSPHTIHAYIYAGCGVGEGQRSQRKKPCRGHHVALSVSLVHDGRVGMGHSWYEAVSLKEHTLLA